jgi:hypothetical protein
MKPRKDTKYTKEDRIFYVIRVFRGCTEASGRRGGYFYPYAGIMPDTVPEAGLPHNHALKRTAGQPGRSLFFSRLPFNSVLYPHHFLNITIYINRNRSYAVEF